MEKDFTVIKTNNELNRDTWTRFLEEKKTLKHH